MLASATINSTYVNADFILSQPDVCDSLVIKGKIITQNMNDIKFIIKPKNEKLIYVVPILINSNTLRRVNKNTYILTYLVVGKNLNQILKNNSALYVYENEIVKGSGKIIQSK